jgi:hypothetical protein
MISRIKSFITMLAFIVIFTTLGSVVAQAQFTPNYSTGIATSRMNSYYSPLATMNRADRERLYRRRSSGGNSGSSGNSGSNRRGGSGTVTGTRSTGGSATATGSTTFRPVSVQPLMPHQLALKQADGSSEKLRNFEKMFSDALTDYKAAVRAKGLPLNDVARAMSFFIYNNYSVAMQGQGPTQAQLEALRDYVREVYLHDQKFQQMSAREKQEIYESLAIWGSIPMAGYLEGKRLNDTRLQAESQRNARTLLEETLGTTLDRIRFTENGIEY